MGTTFTIKIISDKNDFNDFKIKTAVDSLLHEVNRQMSTYISDSEISQFNKSSDTTFFQISDDFYFVVQQALEVSKQTNGAFDITVMPLVELWGFGPDINKFVYPSVAELQKVKSFTGYELIEFKKNPTSIRKKNKNVKIDLSAIAKGFGVDKIADYIESKYISNFMVEIGGEIRANGKNINDENWKIKIQLPVNVDSLNNIVSISKYSIATSGDYMNFVETDSVRFSHTIDPRTGMPVTHNLVSVTVIHSSCTLADAYATAISVLGSEPGSSFAKQLDLPVFMIVEENNSFAVNFNKSFQNFIDNN
jgi:thiamine biosynthesis lipoprotein